jgi:hypothetical protein
MDETNTTPQTGPRPQRNGLYIVWFSPGGSANLGTYYTCTEDQLPIVDALHERAKTVNGGNAKVLDAEVFGNNLSALPITRHPWYEDVEHLINDGGF